MKKTRIIAIGIAFVVLCAAAPVFAAGPDMIPLPYTLKAVLSVNGVVLTAPTSVYTIKVKNTSGTEFQPVDTTGQSYGGATNTARFQYEIPTYDAQDQPNGAHTGTTAYACIEVYRNTTKLTVTYPAHGSCPAGSGQIAVLAAGDSVGFGGIKGQPNDSSHTFTSPITVTATGVTGPTVSVLCNGVAKNSTTAESFGSVNFGQTKNDTACEIKNTGSLTMNLTGVSVSGCGFSLVSPPVTPMSLVTNAYTPITIAFSPCGRGTQTGTLTVSSNDPVHASYPVALTGTGVANVSLGVGWNLVSLPAVPVSTAVGKVVNGIKLNLAVVWGYSGGAWSYYDPNDTTGSTLKTMTIGRGYWFKMKSASTLTIN